MIQFVNNEKEASTLASLVESPEWAVLEGVLERVLDLNRGKLEDKTTSLTDVEFLRGDIHRLRRLLEFREDVRKNRATTASEVVHDE